MKSEVFVLCDFAQDINGKMSLMGAFDTLSVKALPAQHPLMCIASRIRFMIHELGQHAIRVEIKDPDNHYLIPPFENIIQLDNIGDDSIVTGAVLQLAGVTFATIGKYSIKLLVDGNELAATPLYVKKQA